MRPAVHASVIRSRSHRRNRRKNQHIFSARRLLLMVFCGIMLFVPGLALTVVGLENSETDYQGMSEVQNIIYRILGPAMSVVGAIIMFASCLYFYCYGTSPQSSTTPNSQQQSFSEQDQDDKGSIRSKHAHHHHHGFSNQHNGRTVDIHSPDSECRRNLKVEDDSGPNTSIPHRTSVTTEEEVPLAKMDDSAELRKGL